MTVKELSKKLNLKEINCADANFELNTVYAGDLLSWVMGRAKSGNVWVTIMSNINVIAVASLCDVSTVILSEGVTLDADALERAKSQNINIFSTDKTTYEICAEISKIL